MRAESASWQGRGEALELALTHAEQKEVRGMELDYFCSDKRSQHWHKCVFIEPVQSVLRRSRHRKCCVLVLKITQIERCADCKGKVLTS